VTVLGTRHGRGNRGRRSKSPNQKPEGIAFRYASREPSASTFAGMKTTDNAALLQDIYSRMLLQYLEVDV